jgi:hypothetical protein
MDEVWSFEHSVLCAVSTEFAWEFWTDVRTWALDVDVESVELDGDFAAGTHGVTLSRSSGRIEWRIAEVQPGRAVLEFAAPCVVARFVWTFENQGDGTKITQRAELSGNDAAQYIASFGKRLQTGIPVGMRKLCDAMERTTLARSNDHL